MSDQSDALNNVVRSRGVLLPTSSIAPMKDPASETARGLPLVALPRDGRQMISFAREIGEIVGANGLYRRGSVPVTIDPETGDVEVVNPPRFQTYSEEHLTTFCWKGNVVQAETMSLREAQACLCSDALIRPLRKLRRVNQVRLPVMRADGRVELLPKGYDSESHIYTQRDCQDYDPSWDLERARFFLRDLLSEFPFVSERARAAHILAMLAVFGIDLLPVGVKPLAFAYRANAPRAGKGLLASSAIVAPHGTARVQAIPDDSAEFRKVLDSEALNGSAYVLLDEVAGRLANRTLTAFLTASVWSGRVFGSQKHFAVPQTAIIFLLGNNIDLSTDLCGRCVLIDLFLPVANPQDRKIKHEIDERYLARPDVRADILAALYALVRNWDARLRPAGSSVFRGFENFSRIFSGIVEAAGYECPLSVSPDLDSDLADMTALVEKLCEDVRLRKEYDFPEVIAACRELNLWEWHVAGPDELSGKSRSCLGKKFTSQFGGCEFRLSDGRRVRWGHRGKNRQRRYAVEIISQGSSEHDRSRLA